MTAKKSARQKSGRVTPKGTRPAGTAEHRSEHGERGYDGHPSKGGGRPATDRGGGASAPKTFRTGHRGG